jgi:Cu/Ag efflux protein CusF
MKTALMLSLLSIGLFGCSSNEEKKQTAQLQEPQIYEIAKGEVSKTARVKKVDYQKRKITIDIDGKPEVVSAGPEVKNLERIKTGDTVVMTYKEALAYSISKEDKEASDMQVKGESWTAKPGEQPEAGTKAEYTSTVIVKNIDRNTPSVTLENADGEKQTLKVLHPERLVGLEIGDAIDITYSEAIAVKVEKQETTRAPASK